MQVQRSAPSRGLRAGGSCAALLALAALLPAALPLEPAVGAVPAALDRPGPAGPLLVRHAGTRPVVLDTTHLTGPALRAWWTDAVGDRTVDAGAVRRDPAVTLLPPDTGDGRPHDWTLVVVDATRGLVPPA